MRKLILSAGLLMFGISSLFPQGLYDLEHIPEIRIAFSNANWLYILDSLKMAGSSERLPATVSIDGKSFEQVGVRFKGNSSFKNPRSKGQKKLPFNLKADFIKKDQTFPGGYETIKLSNAFQDPSFLREVLSYEIARKYMPAPLCNFAKVYVNGEYYGLYNNTQSVDKVLLKTAFGTNKGTFFKCDPEWEDVKDLENDCPEGDKASLMYLGDDPACYRGWYELESKNEAGWQELIDLTKILNHQPDKVGEAMNVDAVLWMHAFNNVLVNLDSYTGRLSHNYYLYRTPDCLFTPLVWDMNISFGGFRYDGEKPGVLTDEDLQNYSMFAHYKNKNAKRPLITNLLANPLYRKIYAGHCRTIVLENFANGEYLKRAQAIRSIIDKEVKNDPQKLYSYNDFVKNLNTSVNIGYSTTIGITELMEKRIAYLTNHPLFTGDNPVFSEVKHENSGDGMVIKAKVKPAAKVFLASRRHAGEPFRLVEMFDDGEQKDGAAGDEVYGYIFKKKPDSLQYYIIAEGDRLATCSPERAAFQFYEVK